MKCKKCGAEIADDSKFCEFCGVRVKPRLWLPIIMVLIIFLGCSFAVYIDQTHQRQINVEVVVDTVDYYRGY